MTRVTHRRKNAFGLDVDLHGFVGFFNSTSRSASKPCHVVRESRAYLFTRDQFPAPTLIYKSID